MFAYIIRQLFLLLGNIGDFFELIFQKPFRREDAEGNIRRQSWLARLLLFPFVFVRWLFAALVTVLLFPFTRFRRMSAENRRDLLAGVPSLLCIVTIISMVVVWSVQRGSIQSRYRSRLTAAMEAKNYTQAKMLCNRLLSGTDSPDSQLMLSYAEILEKTGDSDRAEAILNELAPDDRIGNRVAHRLKALKIASAETAGSDPELLKKLRWHLQNVDVNTVEINQIWSMYFLAVGQEEMAIKYMEEAAAVNPQLHLAVADINTRIGNPAGTQRALRDAESAFSRLVQSDPLNTESRILLASTYIRQEKFTEAEQALLTGLKLQPDVSIKRALSEYYVLQHDRAVQNRAPAKEQLAFLARALEIDVNFLPIYDRLIRQFRVRKGEELETVRELLAGVIASGSSSALAHFAMSNILWSEGKIEDADWHLAQAYRMDSKFAIIGNNMAWILANRDPPELEQAMIIAKAVVEQVPNNADFRDTLATVLMKQGKLEEAISEFERALPGLKDASVAHASLATLYRKLGREEIAAQHELLAGKK